ncbi:MAG: hypothetical protein LBG72_04920, partial [Spirochaetaceae bacterium]|nr:hypothetical protein [Spirochaetaceae bacterium]
MTGCIARVIAADAVNAALTFGVSALPLSIYGTFRLKVEERSAGNVAKRLFFVWAAVNCLLLFLFSIYETIKYKSLRTCADVFFYLCEEINIKFILAALIVNACIICILRHGKIAIQRGKADISKICLVLLALPLFLTYGSLRFKETYGIVPIEQLIFHLMMSEAGANFSMTYEIITKSAIDVIIFLLLP